MTSHEESNTDVEYFAATLLGGALEHHEEFWEKGEHDMGCPLCRLVMETSIVTNTLVGNIRFEFSEVSNEQS